MARQGYWAPSPREIEAAAEEANRVREPSVARALDSAGERPCDQAPGQRLDGRRRRATGGKTGLSLAWEPAGATRRPARRAPGRRVPAGAAAQRRSPRSPALPRHRARASRRRPPLRVAVAPGDGRRSVSSRSRRMASCSTTGLPGRSPDFANQPVALSTARAFRLGTFQEWQALQAEADPAAVGDLAVPPHRPRGRRPSTATRRRRADHRGARAEPRGQGTDGVATARRSRTGACGSSCPWAASARARTCCESARSVGEQTSEQVNAFQIVQ